MPLRVNVQVLVLLPPLEHAPDQIASRPLVTLSVIEVFAAKVADPALPTVTLMPAGLDVTRSPLRPVAVTVKVTLAPGGFTASAAVLVTPAKTAEIVTAVEAVTEVVVTVKLALVAPVATVTLAGTLAAVASSESDTTAPPEGAAALKVTVPVEELPPWTVVGDSDRAESVGAGGGAALPFTVSVAVRETPFAEAVMVVVRVVSATTVQTGKVALLSPPGTVIVAATVAAAVFELVRETTRPPGGAAPPLRKMVPVTLWPPVTVAGESPREDGTTGGGGGVTVSAVLLVAPKVPVMVTDVDAVTDTVLTVKVTLVAPAGTVTLAGTLAAAELSESVTTAPPVGAAAVKMAVPCEVSPPTTSVGLSVIVESAAGAACAVKRRVEENGPNTPAEFRARTRHHRRCAGRPPMVACEALTI